MAVTCENLTLQRGTFQLSADFTLAAGKSLALVGPSGAGKSLFLAGLAGFETVTSGQITLSGAVVTHTPPQNRPVTLLFQDHNLFPHMTAEQNVGLGIDPGLRLSPVDKQTIAQAFDAVDLPAMTNRFPSELSGGQQGRVALARALVRQRPILLLDEPFSALGPGLRRDMLALVKQVAAQNNTTTIYVTHNPEDAKMADMAAFVGNGSITTPQPADQFFANPPMDLRDYL